jgi:hypothetical protein
VTWDRKEFSRLRTSNAIHMLTVVYASLVCGADNVIINCAVQEELSHRNK